MQNVTYICSTVMVPEVSHIYMLDSELYYTSHLLPQAEHFDKNKCVSEVTEDGETCLEGYYGARLKVKVICKNMQEGCNFHYFFRSVV